ARELLVQRAQEIEAVKRVMLPGVLTVERDEHGMIATRLIVARELRQLLHQVGGGVIAVPGRVGKADQIGQRVVAEETAHAGAAQAVGAVVGERVLRRAWISEREARAQHPGAAGGPAEAGGAEQPERGGTDRALGGPAARGTGAEGACKHAHRLL